MTLGHCQPPPEEEWRAIPGFEPWYSVSSFGRIRRDKSHPRGHGGRAGQILTQQINPRDGRAQISLRVNGARFHRKIHRLVAAAFLGQCPDGYEVNHINRRETDNCASNLEYLTHLENVRHTVQAGAHARGESHGAHKIMADDVRYIRASSELGTILAERLGLSKQTISKIRKRQRWQHIP